jgi:hypothetical protein
VRSAPPAIQGMEKTMTIKCKTAKYANGQRAGLTTLEPVRVASHTGMIDLPAGAWLSCRLASGAANGTYGIQGDYEEWCVGTDGPHIFVPRGSVLENGRRA